MSFELLPKGIFGKFPFRFSTWDQQVNHNWLSLNAHYKGLVISEVLNVEGDLPPTPADGESYILDSDFTVWTWYNDEWFTEDLATFEIFYDLDNGAFYYFDGANIQPLIVNADIIPATTRMLFYEATAPLGWTLDVTVNDRFVRVSDTAGGTVSGTWNNLSHTHGMQNHTHTTPNHSHTGGSLRFQVGSVRRQTAVNNWVVRGFDIGGLGVDVMRTSFQTDTVGLGSIVLGMDAGLSTSNTPIYTGSFTSGSTSSANGGASGAPNNNTTNTPTGLTHGSTQHAYADFIICSRN